MCIQQHVHDIKCLQHLIDRLNIGVGDGLPFDYNRVRIVGRFLYDGRFYAATSSQQWE